MQSINVCVCVSTPVSKGYFTHLSFQVQAGGLEPICLSSPAKLWHFGG